MSQALDRMLPAGAVHQGLAFKVQPLEGVALEDFAEPAEGIIVMLDQLTDPQNVGAIFRSALAFGAKGIVVQDRHSPVLAGALAKASAGATERLPCARVTNLSRALETLADMGWRAVGLDGSSEETLEDALDRRPTVLVMGSEGDGIRRLVAEHCDVLAKIPMPGGFESLNVSNAAAVALYEATREATGGLIQALASCPNSAPWNSSRSPELASQLSALRQGAGHRPGSGGGQCRRRGPGRRRPASGAAQEGDPDRPGRRRRAADRASPW